MKLKLNIQKSNKLKNINENSWKGIHIFKAMRRDILKNYLKRR